MNDISNTSTIRAAIYTRSGADYKFSRSDQEQACRAAVTNDLQNWAIADDCVFSDGQSGKSAWKSSEGLEALLQKAKEIPRPFDYVLVEADYLLARSDSEIVKFVDALAQYGVGVYFVSTKMYSTDPVFRLLFNIKKAMEEHYISSLRQKPRSRKRATAQRPESRCH